MTILDNLKIARQILEQAPELHFNLAEFRNDCGTNFCAAGWLAESTHFKGLGWQWYERGGWEYGDNLHYAIQITNGEPDAVPEGFSPTDIYRTPTLNAQLGPGAFWRLFNDRDYGLWDDDIMFNHDHILTDKELAIARIDRQIAEVEFEQAASHGA